MAGDVFELFCHVLAELLKRAATITAAITWRQDFFLSLKMIGQRCAIVGALGRSLLISFGDCLLRRAGGSNFGIFLKIERQLIHGLGFAAKTGLAMSGQFFLQFLDLIGLRLDFGRHQLADSAQLSGVFGQGFERHAHEYFIPEQSAERNV
jgi:hypothetical protein